MVVVIIVIIYLFCYMLEMDCELNVVPVCFQSKELDFKLLRFLHFSLVVSEQQFPSDVFGVISINEMVSFATNSLFFMSIVSLLSLNLWSSFNILSQRACVSSSL